MKNTQNVSPQGGKIFLAGCAAGMGVQQGCVCRRDGCTAGMGVQQGWVCRVDWCAAEMSVPQGWVFPIEVKEED